MAENKQSQRAGDGSSLVQAGTINYYQGIDEKRAREIVKEQIPEIINAYSQEARLIAEQRVSQFADDFIPKIVKEKLLESLSDPSIQIMIKEAQKSAASSERVEDYSLLSELLIHRMKKDNDRNVRSGVSQAIRIVDEISDEALLGLTVVHSVDTFVPMTYEISRGIKILDGLYSKLLYDKLPQGNAWIDQLDILNAIRISFFGGRKKIDEVYAVLLSGYIDVGIQKETAEYDKALEIIKESDLPMNIICDHELRDGYIRLSLVSLNQTKDLSIIREELCNIGGQQIKLPIHTSLNEKQIEAIKTIYALYDKNGALLEENRKAFMEIWNSYESLRNLQEWWNSIPRAFEITCVGRVLAHANAQRCDSTLPNLD